MKMFAMLVGAIGLMVLVNGCEAPGVYGGTSVGVYGEYPSTYSGSYYYTPSAPVYAEPYYYGHYHRHHGPYDRDHYWDRDRHWGRHGYYYGHY
jgi:hypothetical protein